jgi:hypothetical protein
VSLAVVLSNRLWSCVIGINVLHVTPRCLRLELCILT